MKFLSNLISGFLIVVGTMSLILLAKIGYDMHNYEYYYSDLKRSYDQFVWRKYSEKLKRMPDCGGSIFATIGDTTFEMPRTENVSYRVDGGSGQMFSLKKPVHDFGCDNNNLEEVKFIYYNLHDAFLKQITLSDDRDLSFVGGSFGRRYSYQSDVLSESWENDYLLKRDEKFQMERDYKGNTVTPDKKLEKVKLSDDIIFVERHDAEFYVFSKAAVLTAGEAMHFICPKQWNPYEKIYDDPKLCEISYHHPKGFYVRARVGYSDDFSKKSVVMQERLREVVQRLVVSSE